MRVTFLTCSAHPTYGTVDAGKEQDVPDEIGLDLIAGGYALPLDASPSDAVTDDLLRESAAMQTPETAMQADPTPRKRKGEQR